MKSRAINSEESTNQIILPVTYEKNSESLYIARTYIVQ